MSGQSGRRILVTGGAGFIGSTLVDHLLANGDVVTAVDNFDSFYPRDQKERNVANALRHPGFNLVEIDIRDSEAITSLFDQFPVLGIFLPVPYRFF